MGIFDGIDAERQERIRVELGREIRRNLSEELRASLRQQVEEDVRRESRRELLVELSERAPSEEERERFRAFVREVEIDAYAQATLASGTAHGAEQALARSRRLWIPMAYLLALASPLATWAAHSLVELSAAAFTAFVVTLLLALLLLISRNAGRHHALERRIKQHRRIASDFLIVAERAKAYRMVHAERLVSAEELAERVEELRLAKERQDRQFHPSATELETARTSARQRIEEDMGLRVADIEEDERGDANQHDAVEAPRRRARR